MCRVSCVSLKNEGKEAPCELTNGTAVVRERASGTNGLPVGKGETESDARACGRSCSPCCAPCRVSRVHVSAVDELRDLKRGVDASVASCSPGQSWLSG